MKTYEVKGFILKTTRLSDSRWRLSLFTQELGLVTAWMRASISQKKPLVFEPFMPLWFVVDIKSSGLQIKEIESERGIPLLPGPTLFAGWYFNELLLYLLLEKEPLPELYAAYYHALNQLRQWESQEIFEITLRQFEWILVQTLGYGISLTHEAQTNEKIQPHLFYHCLPATGLVQSPTGVPGEVYLALSEGNWQKEGILKEAKKLMRTLIDHLLDGRPLKTRALYRSFNVAQS